MVYRYDIKNNGKEDILYLFIDLKNEMAKEFIKDSNKDKVLEKTRNIIQNGNIDFKGNKIFLIINGIIVKTLNLV